MQSVESDTDNMNRPIGRANAPAPLRVQIGRGIGYAAVLIAPTWLLFAPILAFRHTVVFGLLAPLVIDGEEPTAPLPFFLGWAEVHFSPVRLLLSLVLWILCLRQGRKAVKWLTRPT
jgi:hypothetical protein